MDNEEVKVVINLNGYTGFNLGLEQAQESKKDWKFMGALAGEDKTPTTFDKDLPIGELQRRGDRDKMTCTNNGGCLGPTQTLMNNRARRGLYSKENLEWAEEIGAYNPETQKFNLSERFNAIRSGTGPNGNSLKAPYEQARKEGFIPEKMLPYVNDYSEYFDKSKVTDEMLRMGREWLEHFPFNYEKVYRHNFDKVLSWSCIGGAGHAWTNPLNGIYPYTNLAINHAFNIFKLKYFITDTYEESKGDFIKQLAPNYLFLHYGYRPIIREGRFWKTPEDVEVAVNNQTYPPGSWLSFWFWWHGSFKKIKGLLTK